eukprot:TRINITY_DN12099_c0_g1_i2.p1 TRINITY_DN12099_c0_g1~~TRINITY_DN12099_c0_g1_i2.p1  ORF type:complete len:525 (+),score=76.62 TRINITY_DN12099_c0_g1_i2:41-1615(+)
MSFAPKKKARSGSTTPRHRVPNIKGPLKSKQGANVPNVKSAVEDYSRWPMLGSDGPMPVCWLCGDECGNFGWQNMPPELSTSSGAALNYYTLCRVCTTAVSQHDCTNAQVISEGRAGGHSDAFITFLREYKVLLELIAVEKARVASVTARKGNSVCHDLSTLRRLLSCVDMALSTYGLTTREKGLLGVELSNLQEQTEIVNNSKFNTKLTLPSSLGDGKDRDALLQTPTSVLPEDPAFYAQTHRGLAWDSRSVSGNAIHTPMPSVAPSASHNSVQLDIEFTMQLQDEMKRLQQSNSDALQKLSVLNMQHKELSAAHEVSLQSIVALKQEREIMLAREAELVRKCQDLTGELAGQKKQHPHETERTIIDLRQRLLETEAELLKRPEASNEIKQSQEARWQAVEEAKQLRYMNTKIGERLHHVEEQLYNTRRESRSKSPMDAPMKALLSSEMSLLSSADHWDVQEHKVSSPPQPSFHYAENTVSASPVRYGSKHNNRHKARCTFAPTRIACDQPAHEAGRAPSDVG